MAKLEAVTGDRRNRGGDEMRKMTQKKNGLKIMKQKGEREWCK